MEADEREEELSTLAAIYPELVITRPETHVELRTASIDIAVVPPEPISVSFQASLDRPLTPPESENGAKAISRREIQYLPPLRVDLVLSSAYPASQPPHISLGSSWVPADTLRKLEAECTGLWSEHGRCQILFTCLDHLQQAADRLFDLVSPASPLSLPSALADFLVKFDAGRRQEVFSSGTFDCGICLEPKKGSRCHKLERCEHVFCKACLQDFYNNAITEGDVSTVKCLEPECGKDPSRHKGRKNLHPRELLAIGIEKPMVRRFVEMKRKKKAESNKDTVYCPRKWCQAPARRYTDRPVPENLVDYPDSEAGVDVEPDSIADETRPAAGKADRIEICSQCDFAFCNVCFIGWHGEFARCYPRDPKELSKEEQASYDYMRLHTSLCPSCNAASQKSHGCNHMICYTCKTHYCYLCGAWLDPGDPYKHFNTKQSTCYMRLWELEEGDDGHGRVNFVGARALEAEAIAHVAAEIEARDAAAAAVAAVDAEQVVIRAGAELDLPHNINLVEGAPAAQLHEQGAGDAAVNHVMERAHEAIGAEAVGPGANAERPREPADAQPDAGQTGPAGRGRGRGRGRDGGNRRRRGGRQAGHLPGEMRGPAGRWNGDDAANRRGHARPGLDRGDAAGVRPAPELRHVAIRDPGDEARVLDLRDVQSVRRFAQMAVADEEDGWNSDELEGDDEVWRIH